MNIVAYFLMRSDKQRAVDKDWRVPEYVFLILCFIGGFIGVHLGMEHYRHKTRHWTFKAAVLVSAVGFLIVLPFYFLFV
ncbi:hypothetical protein CBG46_09330 [Actinobacillus succinogenes]|uniref:DUF1294 domain-containing protein n=1 Tax=Actinobacillus succinogenes (strain ATCC 55618 / DSM 22257 / CCUG 43843 / 130Z) TaxID=339671 RepID=A6VP24_ACTSZ|nr:DUF1294 domain-containing protein [Actinobacillus succinogenes]ABR74721.1 protein of unknown function DUF1294 [Actinobacillus succinogenes 130Z]PHI40859.1 hypothetical protein CBG46_09330 [Actinobacillus succinogenes]